MVQRHSFICLLNSYARLQSNHCNAHAIIRMRVNFISKIRTKKALQIIKTYKKQSITALILNNDTLHT